MHLVTTRWALSHEILPLCTASIVLAGRFSLLQRILPLCIARSLLAGRFPVCIRSSHFVPPASLAGRFPTPHGILSLCTLPSAFLHCALILSLILRLLSPSMLLRLLAEAWRGSIETLPASASLHVSRSNNADTQERHQRELPESRQ